MKYGTLLALLLASLSWSSSVTWDALLKGVDSEPAVDVSRKRTQSLHDDAPSRLFDDVQLSWQMDGLDGREHDFKLKVSPLDPFAYPAWNNYWKKQTSLQLARAERIRSDAVRDRLVKGVEWLYRRRTVELERELSLVYEDRVQVHMGLVGTEKFDAQDLVYSREKAVEQGAELLDASADLERIGQHLRELVPGADSVALDTAIIPDPNQVLALLEQIPQHADSTFPILREAQRRVTLAEGQLEMERADGRRFVDYVQAGYQWDIPEAGKKDKTTGLQDWSIGVGIRMPIGDGSAGEVLKRRIDLQEEQVDNALVKRSLDRSLQERRAQIKSLVDQWRVHNSYVGQVDAGQLFQDFSARAGTDPLLLLKARESSLKTELRAVRLRFETCLQWIELLELSGRLGNSPLEQVSGKP